MVITKASGLCKMRLVGLQTAADRVTIRNLSATRGGETPKALGLTIPQSVLIRADEVLQ